MAKFEPFKDSGGNWRWRLIADNGEKVATRGESFYSAGNARRAAETVKRLASTASVSA
jgi:uncharacterized protein